ncbi:putative leader peptide [Embleya sp. MST-111070]
MSAAASYTAPLAGVRALLTSRRHIDLARVSSAGCR